MHERHATWTTKVGGRTRKAGCNGCEGLPDLLGIRSTIRLKVEHLVQKSLDLHITSLSGEVIQPSEYCRHNLWLVEPSLPLGVCFYSDFEKILVRILFVDVEYLGKDASKRENVTGCVSMFVSSTLW